MAKQPYFQFYYSDWLGSTRRAMMTPAQRGAYIDLLCYQWGDKTCSLPNDDKTLAVLSGLSEGWFNGGSTVLRECFPPHPTLEGRLASPRMLEVRADRDDWVDKSRQGGLKSGESRRAASGKGGSRVVEGCLNTPPPPPPPYPSSSSLPNSIDRSIDSVDWKKVHALVTEHLRGPEGLYTKAKIRTTKDNRRLVYSAAALVVAGILPEGWFTGVVAATVEELPRLTRPMAHLTTCLVNGAEACGQDFKTLRWKVKVPEQYLQTKGGK